MSRSKYTMTDAAAKRITQALYEAWQKGHHLNIEQIEKAFQNEDFYGGNRSNYVKDLVQWMIENNHENFSRAITDPYIREYYEQRQGIRELTDGLMRLGVVPYPEED